jgi:predicted GTPase
MGNGFVTIYEPRPATVSVYQKRYQRYKKLGEMLEEQLRM